MLCGSKWAWLCVYLLHTVQIYFCDTVQIDSIKWAWLTKEQTITLTIIIMKRGSGSLQTWIYACLQTVKWAWLHICLSGHGSQRSYSALLHIHVIKFLIISHVI